MKLTYIGIFSEMGVSPEKVFTFMRGPGRKVSLRLNPGQVFYIVRPNPNPPLLIRKGCFVCYCSVLVF